MTLDKIGKYEFLIEPFHCDFSQCLFVGHLGNHLLNAADFHSNDRGFGMNYLSTIHKTWVLSRLAIELESLPKAYSRMSVETWIDGVMRFFTHRNFKMTDVETGDVYGYGRSVWAMIDTETRQPADILAVKEGGIVNYVDDVTPCPIEASSRVKIGGEADLVGSVETHYSDVDINGHINSVKYLEHLFDLMTESWHQVYRVQRVDVAYVAESHFGDVLHYYKEEVAPDEELYRIVKCTLAGETAEVCRVAVKWVAK